MSDQFSMGRTDAKGRGQEQKLRKSLQDGKASVAGARKSLSKVPDSFKSQAEVLVDRADAAFSQVAKLVEQGQYTQAGEVVDAFEKTNGTTLTALEERVESGQMPLNMVAVLVQNLRTARDLTVGL